MLEDAESHKALRKARSVFDSGRKGPYEFHEVRRGPVSPPQGFVREAGGIECHAEVELAPGPVALEAGAGRVNAGQSLADRQRPLDRSPRFRVTGPALHEARVRQVRSQRTSVRSIP